MSTRLTKTKFKKRINKIISVKINIFSIFIRLFPTSKMSWMSGFCAIAFCHCQFNCTQNPDIQLTVHFACCKGPIIYLLAFIEISCQSIHSYEYLVIKTLTDFCKKWNRNYQPNYRLILKNNCQTVYLQVITYGTMDITCCLLHFGFNWVTIIPMLRNFL